MKDFVLAVPTRLNMRH